MTQLFNGKTFAFLVFQILGCFMAAFALPPDFSQTNILPSIVRGTSVTQVADGRLYISELGGAVKTYKDGASYTIRTVPTSNARSEQGLFAVVEDPAYATNGWLYAHYFVYVNGGNQDYHVIMRFTMSPPLGGTPQYVPGSDYLIYRMPNLPDGASRHNGGQLVFGNDGYLYIAKGEGEHQDQAEVTTNVFGKLIRIDPRSTSASNDNVNGHYGIPPGNAGLSKPEIYAMGFRNPWSMSKDPSSDDIYIGDVGGTEEINRILPSQHSGKRFGWGAGGNSGAYNCADAAYVCPMLYYGGGAITGVAVKRNLAGNWPAAYLNTVFYSDHNGSWIRYTPIGQNNGQAFDASGHQPLGLVFGKVDGQLYYCRYNGAGGLWQVRYDGSAVTAPSITTHPVNATVSSGNPAAFAVVASGSTLAYRWQRAAIGSTSFTDLTEGGAFTGTGTANLSVVASQAVAGQFRAVVSNSGGSATSNAAQLAVTAANASPVILFAAPAQGALFTVPENINFSATATDAEDGILPAGSFNWVVELAHRTSPTVYHSHPVTTFDGVRSGTFASTVAGEPSAQVWLLFILTVTDASGNTDRDTVLVYPRLTTLDAKSVPPGLTIVVMDQVTTDVTLQAVIGNDGRINGNTPQYLNGTRYDFDHWEFSGAVPAGLNATTVFQNFIVGSAPASFTAHYRATANPLYAIRAVDNEYVTLLADNRLQSTVTAVAGNAQRFEIGANADATLFLKSAANGLYCQAVSAPVDVTCDAVSAAGAAAKWIRTNNADGTVYLRNQGTNQFLVAEGGGSQPLKANRGGAGGWEKFTLVAQTPPGPQFAVTLAIAAPSGTVSPAAGSVTQVAQGGSLSVTATPAAGYLFDRWTATAGLTLANANAASTQVSNVTANGTVSAYFIVDPTPPPSGNLFAIKAVDNEFVSVLPDNRLQPTVAVIAGNAQLFEIGTNADATLFIKSAANGLYCQAVSAAVDVTCDAASPAAAAAKWTRTDNADGTASLKNVGTNQYLVAEGGGTGFLKANRGGIGGWEKFTITAQTPPGPRYGITLAVESGSGTLVPAAGITVQVAEGGVLSITAVPQAGWLFEHWHASAGLTLANANSAATQLLNVRVGGTVEAHFSADPNPPTAPRYALRAVNGQYVTLLADARLQPNSATVAGVNQVFEIGSNGDATYSLKSVGNGSYCQAVSGAVDVTCNAGAVSSNAAKWIRVDNANGTVAFRNLGTNQYLVAEGGGSQPLKANRANISGWESFTIQAQ